MRPHSGSKPISDDENEETIITNTGGLRELIRTHRLPFFTIFLIFEVTVLGVAIYLTSDFKS